MKLNNVASRREFLKTMPTQELDEMLQAELRKENIDADLVRLILHVLEEREADHPIETNAEVAAAVEKYTAYLEDIETTPAKPARRWSVMLKVASVLMIVGLLLFAVPQAVHAESFFEMLARWTDSIFEFFTPDNDNKQPEYVFETDHPGLQRIYDTVVELGVTDPVVPMWVPDGYELQVLQVVEQSSDTIVLSEFIEEENYILFNMLLHSKEVPFKYEKDTRNIEILELGGVEYYTISNVEEQIVTWIIDRTECSIITNCQAEDLYRLLESIYVLED